MDNGFILLSRGILDSDVFASQKLLKIWVWCLCKANFKDKKVPLKIGKGETIITIKRGCFIFGRHKAEGELFIDGSTIYKSMQKLKDMDMINIESNNQYSIVTICKYNDYQNAGEYQITTNDQPMTNQVTTNDQPSNTTKKDNKDKNIDSIDSRKLKFASTLQPFLLLYGKDMLNDFYAYWTEHGEHDKKFRSEKEKSFSIERRLETWKRNEKTFHKQPLKVEKL